MVLNFLKTLGRIFLWFLLMLLVGVLNSTPVALGVVGKNLPVEQQWGSAILYLLLTFAVIHLLMKWYFKQPNSGSKEAHFDRSQWKYLFLGWGIIIGANIVIGIFRTLFGLPEEAENQQIVVESLGTLKDLGEPYLTAFMISIGIFAPVLEETVCRGLGSKFVFRGWANGVVALLTSLAFGINHLPSLDWFALLSYSTMGYVLYWAYARRNNIWDAIWLHMFNNSLSLVAMLLLGLV